MMGPNNNLAITDPLFSVRDAIKQLVMLEDHLVHVHKRCPDCIHKHFFWAEGLLEEAINLSPNNCPEIIRKLATIVNILHGEYTNGMSPCKTAAILRGARKKLFRVWMECMRYRRCLRQVSQEPKLSYQTAGQ